MKSTINQSSGEVVILHEDFKSGFIRAKGQVREQDNIFFVPKTKFKNFAYHDLKLGSKVCVEYVNTKRGPVARALELLPSKSVYIDPSQPQAEA